MKEYEYHGYVLKQEHRPDGFGLQWAVYKEQELIAYADREGIAKETADWHAEYTAS